MNEPASFAANAVRIAVAPRLFAGEHDAAGAWRQQQLFFEHTLIERLTAAGALIVGTCLPASPTLAQQVAAAYARECDGLVLQGGTNIASASTRATLMDHDLARDRFELDLVAAFLAADKAVLGICRGMQLLNVAFGGSVHTLLDAQAAHHSDPSSYAAHMHAVELASARHLARLFDTTRGTVSSAHRQAVHRLGSGLDLEATCPDDGCVEAIKSREHRHVLGIQWHPEFDAAMPGRLSGDTLFRDFVAHARVG
jgi:putative glutamine amidotransferase